MTSDAETESTERKEIENKDKDVVRKFRSVVETKELKKKQQKSRINILAGVAVGICAVLLALVVSFSNGKFSLVSKKETIPQNVNKEATKQTSPPTESDQSVSKKDLPHQADLKTNPPESQPSKKETVPKKTPQFEKNKKEIKTASIVKPDKKTSSQPSKKKSEPGAIRVAEIITCQNIKDRQHVSPQNEFSVKDDSKVYVWMNVAAKKPPQTIKLVYYKNGSHYRTIPLSIKRAEMRTWSYISLNNLGDVGKWRVDVVAGEGEPIANLEFTVVP